MADVNPTLAGTARWWELATTSISSVTSSDVAVCGINNMVGSIYIVTSGTVLMTIQIRESTDKTNWIVVEEREITGDTAFRIAHPFPYLDLNVSARTGGTIDSIKIFGITN